MNIEEYRIKNTIIWELEENVKKENMWNYQNDILKVYCLKAFGIHDKKSQRIRDMHRYNLEIKRINKMLLEEKKKNGK